MQTLQRSRIFPAVLSGGINFFFLFLLQRFVDLRSFVVLLVLFVLSIIGLRFFFYPRYQYRYPVFPVSLSIALSTVGLLFVVEIAFVREIVTILVIVLQALLWGWGGEDEYLTVSMKPFRRFVVSCWVFCAYSSITTLFALIAFFPQRWIFLSIMFLGAGIYGTIALHIWKLYFQTSIQSLLLWTLLVCVVCIEMLWVVSLLPFAYGFLGFICTWFWYVLQLFARFHFSQKGILWKKQLPFLISNVILFGILLLFFVRWV